MSTTDTTWTAEDLHAAQERARLARDEADRLQALADAQVSEARDAVSSAVQAGRDEARRRHPVKPSAASATEDRANAADSTEGPDRNGTTAADGIAEARRRAGRR